MATWGGMGKYRSGEMLRALDSANERPAVEAVSMLDPRPILDVARGEPKRGIVASIFGVIVSFLHKGT